ncbi:MAG: S8 family serine peptidase [Polyangiaceae bacterium]
MGVGVGVVVATTMAQGAPNPNWPPDPSIPIASLATPKFWPSDSAYGYTSDNPGQWWLYSFVPERSTSAVVLRQPNLPAGLSVDAAWQQSIGLPQVVLAILDDGVDVTEPELSDSILLNVGELRKILPTHADGSSCARLDPASLESPVADCSTPPDGVLTLADYRESLGWSDGAIGIDPNANGRLDVEDLFLLGYADGIDDDGNGFVDDIAGWDFVDSDNTPFPVSSASGTEAALDAAAQANDGVGRAGVCPRCRVLPVRVGHQRGANPQTLALGLLYASSLALRLRWLATCRQGGRVHSMQRFD